MSEVKSNIDSLAVFGGPQLFDYSRPIGQLAAPDVDLYLAELKAIFDAKRFSNDGPFVRELEDRLAAYHGTRYCVAVANAGLGIIMMLQMFAHGRRGEVIMPAFSYRGLPHFARWAGQGPCFCDVEKDSHALDPTRVAEAINERTTSILAVFNCHDTGNIEELSAIASRRNIPIVFDSVNALGATHRGRRLGSFGDAEVYSLHATKLLNGFEGGYIVTDSSDISDRMRWQRNFCFPALRPECVAENEFAIGTNAKLNELHAAMALLGLERLGTTIARNRERFEAYQTVLQRIAGLRLLTPFHPEHSNYSVFVAEVLEDWPLTRDETVTLLQAEGAAINAYYSPPLHRSPHASADLSIPDLPVSETLARVFFHLPSGELVSDDDIDAVGNLLRFVAKNGSVIAARLRAGG